MSGKLWIMRTCWNSRLRRWIHRAIPALCLCWALPAVAGTPDGQSPAVEAVDRSQAPSRQQLLSAIRRLEPLARRQPEPKGGDWRDRHIEPGQTFTQWLTSEPALPDRQRCRIYLQPLGDFSAEQQKILRRVASFLEAAFHLPVRTNKPLGLEIIPDKARRLSRWGQEQILTTYVLEKVLKPRLPEDAACVLALTAGDLWPGEGANFVFGQASTTDRVGVCSLHRFGRPERNETQQRKVLLRTLKTALHETGHMFSMEHCTAWRCAMAGANSLEEADTWPLALCPECMAKVCTIGGVRPLQRYRKLADLCKAFGLAPQEQFYRRCTEALEAKE